MMFNANLVAVVKANGKVLREDRSNSTAPTVYLPFKSEYSILLKNLNSKRAAVSVTIDGQDVLDGRQIILDGNTETELERFLTDDMTKGNRFKFIEKTEKISDHRGDKVDDGIVRIEYQFEEPVIQTITINNYPWYYRSPSVFPNSLIGSATGGSGVDGSVGALGANGDAGINTVYGSSNADTGMLRSFNAPSMMYDCFTPTACLNSVSAPVNDDGITVKGSISNQKFHEASIGKLENTKHVITLMLRGQTKTKVVEAPVTVKFKCKCETCGMVHRGFPKYCMECGTAMNL